MTEFYIRTTSFAAPFVSDADDYYESGATPEEALLKVVGRYSHPAGLYAAVCFDSHKNQKVLARWLCNHEQAKLKATKKKGSYVYRGNGPGDFEVDGKHVTVEDPKGGSLVP